VCAAPQCFGVGVKDWMVALSREKGALDTHAPSHTLLPGLLIAGWQGMDGCGFFLLYGKRCPNESPKLT
jgi:hypothetical protein